MRKTMRVIAQFTFYDRTGIEAYLEEKAEKGWMLEKISPWGWKFRRMEPKKLHFAVTYFPKASVFDPELTEGQRTMEEFCAYAGWKLVDANGPMQIYCNEAENPRPIETDPVTELAAIHASARKSYLPSYIMLLVVALLNIGLQIGNLISSPLDYLCQNSTVFNWICQLCLLTMCSQEVFGYFLWYRKARRVAEETGDFVETKGHRKFQLFLLSVVIVAFGWLIMSLKGYMAKVMGITMISIFSVYGLVLGMQYFLKRMKASREMNRGITIGMAIVLPIIMSIVLVNSIMEDVETDWDRKREEAEAYDVNGLTFYAYHDELPLYVEDLTETDYDRYSTSFSENSSVLLSIQTGKQDSRVGEQAPEIRYEIYDVHLPILYDMCLDALLREYEGWYSEDIYGNLYQDEYFATDATAWRAERAYQLNSHAEAYYRYLLCYDNRLVTVYLNWEPDVGQMAAIADTLNK